VECVNALRERDDVVLGIATGKSRRGVRHLLDRQDWHDVFATIQTAEDAPSKPHPAMIRQAMDAVGITAPDTLMVGDSSYDMAMARAAGALPIGVAWGFQSVDTLREAGAERIVHSYAALRAELDSLLEPSNLACSSPI
jgi:phosphoglycolate phosphatase